MEQVLEKGFEVEIDRGEVRRLLGIKEYRAAAPRVEEAIEQMMSLAAGMIEPMGIYTIIKGDDFPGSSRFVGLERVALGICTIGKRLEEQVSEFSRTNRLLDALVLDSVGSVAAEAAAEYLDGVIQDAAHDMGLKTSCRASPGYGDWDVREQESIFAVLSGAEIGVSLTDSFMMVPRKSVSFAIDIAERPARMRSADSCRECPIVDCPYRLI